MNKKALVVVLIVVLLIAAVISTGVYLVVKFVNVEKEALTAKEFISIMEEQDFLVGEVTDQFEDADIEVEKAYVAFGDDYQIEFYTFEDEENAEMFFKVNKAKFDEDSASSRVSLNGKNFTSFSITVDGEYRFVERVDETVIYLDVDEEYKNEVKELVKEELGY